jgi:hypothetical protein
MRQQCVRWEQWDPPLLIAASDFQTQGRGYVPVRIEQIYLVNAEFLERLLTGFLGVGG